MEPKVIKSSFVWRDIPFKQDVKGVIIHSMGQYLNGVHAPEFLYNIKNSKGQNVASAHAFIEPNGDIILGQDIKKIAYHAGQSKWKGEINLNNFTLGIEFLVEGNFTGNNIFGDFIKKIKTPVYTDKQYESGAWLINKWKETYPKISKEYILKHSEISGKDVRPDPKYDPGDGFDFVKLLNNIK